MDLGDVCYHTGLDFLDAVTRLTQRQRSSHPTHGLFEAADFQWWWRVSRASDELPQLFWFADDEPVAATILTVWSDRVALDPVLMPGLDDAQMAEVVERGLAHASTLGFDTVAFEVDAGDGAIGPMLDARGFATDDGVVETWLDAAACPAVSDLPDGYRLTTRAATADRPHHMISDRRGHPDPEPRLRQTSLYRDDLDLVVLAPGDEVAAYGLFWHDPVSATGLVEPMRTEDEHQRRGLARHVLTAGVERLVRAGAERIKICYEPDNPAAGHLYTSAGFAPARSTVMRSGPTG